MGWMLLALLFAGLWVYAVYREDLRNPEPVVMLLLAAVAGGASAIAAEHLERRLLPSLDVLHGPLAGRAAAAFFVAGPVEEGVKLLAVMLVVWPWTDFDEPVDGIVYGAAAGAGFALAENLAWMQGQPEIILSRGPVGTGAHVLFSTLWGGALGHAGHLKAWTHRAGLVALGLLLAVLAHGVFDLIVFSIGREIT